VCSLVIKYQCYQCCIRFYKSIELLLSPSLRNFVSLHHLVYHLTLEEIQTLQLATRIPDEVALREIDLIHHLKYLNQTLVPTLIIGDVTIIRPTR
jgi:hypothetical protein